MAKDRSYRPGVYREQGGTKLVAATGGTIQIDSGGALEVATGAKFTRGVRTATANITLSAAESGVTVIAAAADLRITLPSTAAGLRYTVILATGGLSNTTGTTGLKVVPAAADAITGNGLNSTDGERLRLSATADREGDMVSVVGDGSIGWYIEGTAVGTWVKSTAT